VNFFRGSREDRIRTCDPLVPNQVFYRAELPPVPLRGCKYRSRTLKKKFQLKIVPNLLILLWYALLGILPVNGNLLV
jgi:hypothetical protein